MKHTSYITRRSIAVLFVLIFSITCSGGRKNYPTAQHPGKMSPTTGVPYNRKGRLAVASFPGQIVGPNLVFVAGGTFIMGSLDDNSLDTKNCPKRTISVSSFFMDATPVTNIAWIEMMDWLKQYAPKEFLAAATPDETVWKDDLAYNDSLIKNYLKYPGFRLRPVIGVSWVQAKFYAWWRTLYTNLYLIEKARCKLEDLANYTLGEIAGCDLEEIKDSKLSELAKYKLGDLLKIEQEDEEDEEDEDEFEAADEESEEQGQNGRLEEIRGKGILLPSYYGLPTEVQWEYAAKCPIGTQNEDGSMEKYQKIYPWKGHGVRGEYGELLANFRRARGNNKGIAGEANSNCPTTDVHEYPPNDIGLYDMPGNVSEYVQDTYRPRSAETVNNYNSVRRDGTLDSEDNYKESNPLINDRARTIKGASWKDSAYWVDPGKRRFVDKDAASATVGFRCAMTSAGS